MVDLGYDFEQERFHLEGDYKTADGSTQHGFIEVAFAVADDEIVARIVDHDVEGIDNELETLNDNITMALRRYLDSRREQEILQIEQVRVAGSDLMVNLVHEGIEGVVPLR